ncbi:MAG TPA: TetR/AcrR family transcriptional regulator [Aldersonia sp.]
MATPTRRTQASRADRRARMERDLLEATERLMNDGATFTELSIDRLASEAGLSRATFYVYFEDKADLLRRLAAQVLGELAAQRWWSVAARGDAGNLSDAGDLRDSCEAIVARYREHQVLIGAAVEMAAYTPDIAAWYRDLIGEIVAGFEDVIRRGQAAGTIRASLPAHATATSLVWMVERTCVQVLPHSPVEDDAELARSFSQIIWSTLYLAEPD